MPKRSKRSSTSGIAIRDELTNEWQKRGVKEQREYAIITAEISCATFDMTPTEYKAYKSLDKPADNLRDHMTDPELIFYQSVGCRFWQPQTT